MKWLLRTFGAAFVRKLGYAAAAAALAAVAHFLR
jgi:hypothetical protein